MSTSEINVQLLTEGAHSFLSFDTQRSLTTGSKALWKELSHLETFVREVQLDAQINLSLTGFCGTSRLHKEVEDTDHTLDY
jgi:hypothetical protein